MLDNKELEELEQLDILEAEGRRIYDPLTKNFDHGNKRATDCPENKKVSLPKSVDTFSEGSLELRN